MKLIDLKLDLAAIDDGQWVSDIPDLPGVAFLVRGSEYEPYQAALRKATVQDSTQGRKGRLEQLRGRTLDQEVFAKAMNRAVAQHLLIGWDGLDQDDGTPLPFSLEMALTFMTDRAYLRLKEGVQFAIEAVAAGLADHREEAAGN